MRGNNSTNASILACKGRVRKASKVRKNGQIFGPKMFGLPLYLRMQCHQHQSSAAQMAQHTKCARKAKRKGRERKRERRKKCRIKSQKKNQKTFPCAYLFPPWPLRHDLSWVQHFGSAWLWRTTYLFSFSSKLCLISCLCWIPEVIIQPYPHFGSIFQNPWPFKGYICKKKINLFLGPRYSHIIINRGVQKYRYTAVFLWRGTYRGTLACTMVF